MKLPFNFRLDKELIDQAKAISTETKRTLTQFITDAILFYIKNHKDNKK